MKRLLYIVQNHPLETIFFALLVVVDMIGAAQGWAFAEARSIGSEPAHYFFLAGEYPPLFCILACVINLPVFAVYVPFHLVATLGIFMGSDFLMVVALGLLSVFAGIVYVIAHVVIAVVFARIVRNVTISVS